MIEDDDVLGRGFLPEEDEKWFGKLTWNINDDHRAVVSYNRDKGNVATIGRRLRDLAPTWRLRIDLLELLACDLQSRA